MAAIIHLKLQRQMQLPTNCIAAIFRQIINQPDQYFPSHIAQATNDDYAHTCSLNSLDFTPNPFVTAPPHPPPPIGQ